MMLKSDLMPKIYSATKSIFIKPSKEEQIEQQHSNKYISIKQYTDHYELLNDYLVSKIDT